MKKIAAAAVVVLALSLVPGAAAKPVSSLFLIGARGRSAELRPGAVVYRNLTSSWGALVSGQGGYLLVYPVLGHGASGKPGRYHPATGAYCSSWTLDARFCYRVADRATRRAIAARHLPVLRAEPTVATEVVDARTALPVKQEIKAIFELAFARRSLASAMPVDCSLEFTARWSGGTGANRPASFCLSPTGAWAGGKLYPLAWRTWDFVRLNP